MAAPTCECSVLSWGDDTRESDIDLLVDTAPNTTLFDLGGLKVALEELLDVAVDLLTPHDLPVRLQSEIVALAKPVKEL